MGLVPAKMPAPVSLSDKSHVRIFKRGRERDCKIVHDIARNQEETICLLYNPQKPDHVKCAIQSCGCE